MILKKNKISRNTGQTRFSFIVWMLILLSSALSIYSKDLKQYKENIRHLQIEFASIISEDVDENFINEVFDEIPELLPDEEKIDIGRTTLDVNNKWLGEEVARYKKSEDENEKTLILYAIFERLEAIEIKINELERAESGTVSKDEEKRKLAEILKREEYSKPAEEDLSLFQRFLNWLDEWMQKNAPKQRPNPLPASNLGGVAYVMQMLLYGLLTALIVFLIYKFAPFFIKKYREREKHERKERIILGEKIASDETSANLFSEAEKLAGEGNLRDAIRKGYIAFLFELSERKLIGLAKHKTNRDYLRSVRKKRELHKMMDGLTSNYERHWYGFEDANERDWQEFRKIYNETLKQ